MLLDSGNQKIRIFSKKLPSGKCQVKFFVNSDSGNTYYGYTLVKSGCKVSDVFIRIYRKLQEIDHPDMYFHGHLYRIGTENYPDPNFIIFRENVIRKKPDPIGRANIYRGINRSKSKTVPNDNT